MTILSWRARRQFVYFGIFGVSAALILWWVVAAILPNPTCFDGKQNQKEEGVDCGGPCDKKCVGEVLDPVVLWARAIEVEKGNYDAAAMIENPNLFTGTKSFSYRFKLYDEQGVLVAVREGETFVNPGERFIVFEPGIITRERIPVRTVLELQDTSAVSWERIEREKPKLLITKKEMLGSLEFPYLQARVRNDSLFDINNIYAVGIIYDEEQNVRAISSTKIDKINPSSENLITFTWKGAFDFTPGAYDVLLRINQTN